jgi:hypothetical protein
MVDLSRASRAQKVLLPVATKEASIAHHLEHLWPTVDDDGELLAREGSVWRGGSPRLRIFSRLKKSVGVKAEIFLRANSEEGASEGASSGGADLF